MRIVACLCAVVMTSLVTCDDVTDDDYATMERRSSWRVDACRRCLLGVNYDAKFVILWHCCLLFRPDLLRPKLRPNSGDRAQTLETKTEFFRPRLRPSLNPWDRYRDRYFVFETGQDRNFGHHIEVETTILALRRRPKFGLEYSLRRVSPLKKFPTKCSSWCHATLLSEFSHKVTGDKWLLITARCTNTPTYTIIILAVSLSQRGDTHGRMCRPVGGVCSGIDPAVSTAQPELPIDSYRTIFSMLFAMWQQRCGYWAVVKPGNKTWVGYALAVYSVTCQAADPLLPYAILNNIR